LKLRILVDRNGQIRNVLTERIDEGSAGLRLLEKLRQGLRFPALEKPTWGWLEVRR
jgi:hypothetical protein